MWENLTGSCLLHEEESSDLLGEFITVINKSGKHPKQLVAGDILQNVLISTFIYLFSLPIG